MDTFRTLKIYGHRSTDVEYSVVIDNELTDNSTDELFCFQTNTKFHGALDVSITVVKGSLTITHVTATYPAEINNHAGYITMIQPIAEPVGIVTGSTLNTLPFPITVDNGQTFCYKHLMFNGPTKYIVSLNEDSFEGMNLYVGNFLNNELNPAIGNIEYVFEYHPLPGRVNSVEDFSLLKQLVILNLAR